MQYYQAGLGRVLAVGRGQQPAANIAHNCRIVPSVTQIFYRLSSFC
jgi:hypothetical protein